MANQERKKSDQLAQLIHSASSEVDTWPEWKKQNASTLFGDREFDKDLAQQKIRSLPKKNRSVRASIKK
jgi:hypothetical protein